MSKYDQWIRKVGLFVFSGEKALDLSDLRIVFEVQNADIETPNNASIRVYNLSAATIKRIQGEFSSVSLNAGYQNGSYGVIFQGTIKQFRIGKDDNVSTYLDILAADGDVGYNQGFVNKVLAKGTNNNAAVASLAAGMPQVDGGNASLVIDKNHTPNIRGQVFFGMPRAFLRNFAKTYHKSWSIQNGQLVFFDNNYYDKNSEVELSAATGLVGFPEQTDGGIRVRCLLNSRITIGSSIKLNNSIINTLVEQNPNNAPVPYNQRTGIYRLASLSADGTYRVFVVEHEGDTRGNKWYSNIIALAVNQTSPTPVSGQ